MRTPLAAILLVLALGLTPMVVSEPAIGAERSEEDPEELMREGMERMLRAIELMIEMIPQYEPPEINEDGDIIIRRKRAPEPGPEIPEEEET